MAGSAATMGPFTVGTARLVRKGGLDISVNDSGYEDQYTLVLGPGGRPSATQDGMPQLGDDGMTGFAVSRIRWTQRALDSVVWDAVVTYRRGSSTTKSDETFTDIEKTWGTRTVQADFTQDANTFAAVVNTAGDPFERVPQRELVCPSLSIRRISSKPPAQYLPYNGTVNASSETIMGVAFQEHCARIMIEARELDGGKYEYSIRIDGAINMYSANATSPSPVDIGWDVSMLNCGYTYLDPNGDRRVILVPDGAGKMVRPTEPQLLDMAGDMNPGGVYFLRFSPYAEMNWSGLYLPEA